MEIDVNGQRLAVPAGWHEESLLWLLREAFGLVGTKFGCGAGICGACTVLVDGDPQRACLLYATEMAGKKIVTIEGLQRDGRLSAVQAAWETLHVPQCGYCQAGQLMSATALLARDPAPSDAAIAAAMDGNLCRCGTYDRIRQAIHLAAGSPP